MSTRARSHLGPVRALRPTRSPVLPGCEPVPRWRRISLISAAVRASGGAPGERSYYPALAGLLGAVGGTLAPKVFCVLELAD